MEAQETQKIGVRNVRNSPGVMVPGWIKSNSYLRCHKQPKPLRKLSLPSVNDGWQNGAQPKVPRYRPELLSPYIVLDFPLNFFSFPLISTVAKL